ncbi:MAG: hypothetical protein HY329_13255 [Chloroflexi bacterium]|nr:hypothetical protein [Chloroflexota bacterium]
MDVASNTVVEANPLMGPHYLQRLEQVGLNAEHILLSDLDLSNRVCRQLWRAGLRTLGQVARLTEEQARQVHGLGTGGITELRSRAEEVFGRVDGLRRLVYGERLALSDPEHDELEGPVFPPGYLPTLSAARIDPQRVTIDMLGLSARTRNSLFRARLVTLDRIARLSVSDVLTVRNFGTKSLGELQAAAARLLERTDEFKLASHVMAATADAEWSAGLARAVESSEDGSICSCTPVDLPIVPPPPDLSLGEGFYRRALAAGIDLDRVDIGELDLGARTY